MRARALVRLVRSFAAACILLAAVVISHAQSSIKSGCSLIDESRRAAQYINFEGFYKPDSTIKFSLHNNTTCSIIVETDENRSVIARLPDRGIKIATYGESLDGALIGLHYQVQNRRHWNAPENAYGWGDSVFTYEIKPGESAVFFVPSSHFKKNLDLTVPFCYRWEGGSNLTTGFGGVSHRVYFLHDDLPKELLK